MVKGIPNGFNHSDTIESYFDGVMEELTKTMEDYVYEVKILSENEAVVSFNDHSRKLTILPREIMYQCSVDHKMVIL